MMMIDRRDIVETCRRSAAYAERQAEVARRQPQTARQLALCEYWRGWRDAAKSLEMIFDHTTGGNQND